MERSFRLLATFCLAIPTLQASDLTQAIHKQHAGYITHRKASYENNIYALTAGAIGLFFGAHYLFGTTTTEARTTHLVCTAAFSLITLYNYSESQRNKRVAAFYLLQKHNTLKELSDPFGYNNALANTHKIINRPTLTQEAIAHQDRSGVECTEKMWAS